MKRIIHKFDIRSAGLGLQFYYSRLKNVFSENTNGYI